MNDEARPNLEPIEKMVDGLGVDAVFSEPIREGSVTVVPVAEVRFGFGYGMDLSEKVILFLIEIMFAVVFLITRSMLIL